MKELGSTTCYTKVCGGQDNLDHVSQCFGYTSKSQRAGASNQNIANYLFELNKERNILLGVDLQLSQC